ncbi:MAG: hypothetical protein DI573_14160 [Microbacterium sp.]|uniref:hypothetical protein n=1 Tax=Microbacterium sp. TaxID=51671 RepID=UPI000DB13519|nr:hypothetical protein [Microbacterium sp.]PZU36205.1 MAG: hypothetical protein DI573_14160 [Microbacterium sp.]
METKELKGFVQESFEDRLRNDRVPMLSIRSLRLAIGITIDELRTRIFEMTGHQYGRGTISAVELGHRGASVELLGHLERAYGLEAGSLETAYPPKRQKAAAPGAGKHEAGAA